MKKKTFLLVTLAVALSIGSFSLDASHSADKADGRSITALDKADGR
ncbi:MULTISPECIES: hypothetical protein [Shouchella]|uniref:Uncharacterized protein n=1 Tax=Shouchella lehensis G1 TaxID=1246626 RepID=A0A060M1H5_9BACI|nr:MULTISPECIES: hypothetical protein [Bacillaceae]AIC95875.1 hypothetical protein BleG1_3328 [Shouchella lehensis G1]